MIFLGHVGIVTAAGQAYNQVGRRRLDLRLAALASILPDLIDKPLGLSFPEAFGFHTKLYAHSILACLVVLAILVAARRRLKEWPALWLAFCSHAVLDRMWEHDREMLFWPLLGEPPSLGRTAYTLFFVGGFRDWVLASEALGGVLLLAFVVYYRLYRWKTLKTLLLTGLIETDRA